MFLALGMGSDGLKQVDAIGVSKVGHGDAHGVFEEGTSVVEISI